MDCVDQGRQVKQRLVDEIWVKFYYGDKISICCVLVIQVLVGNTYFCVAVRASLHTAEEGGSKAFQGWDTHLQKDADTQNCAWDNRQLGCGVLGTLPFVPFPWGTRNAFIS